MLLQQVHNYCKVLKSVTDNGNTLLYFSTVICWLNLARLDPHCGSESLVPVSKAISMQCLLLNLARLDPQSLSIDNIAYTRILSMA